MQFFGLATLAQNALDEMVKGEVEKKTQTSPVKTLPPAEREAQIAKDVKSLYLARLAVTAENLMRECLMFGALTQAVLAYENEETPAAVSKPEEAGSGSRESVTSTASPTGVRSEGESGATSGDEGDERTIRHKEERKREAVLKYFEAVKAVNEKYDLLVAGLAEKLAEMAPSRLYPENRPPTVSEMDIWASQSWDVVRQLETVREDELTRLGESSPFKRDRLEKEKVKFGRIDSQTSKLIDAVQPTVCWLAKMLIGDQAKLTEYVLAANENIKGTKEDFRVIPEAVGADLVGKAGDYVEVKVNVLKTKKSGQRHVNAVFGWPVSPNTAFVERNVGRRQPEMTPERQMFLNVVYAKTGGRKGGFIATVISEGDVKVVRRYKLSGFFMYCFFRYMRTPHKAFSTVNFGDEFCENCKSFHRLDMCQWFDVQLKALFGMSGFYDSKTDAFTFSSQRNYEVYALQLIKGETFTGSVTSMDDKTVLDAEKFFDYPWLGRDEIPLDPIVARQGFKISGNRSWNLLYEFWGNPKFWDRPGRTAYPKTPCVRPWVLVPTLPDDPPPSKPSDRYELSYADIRVKLNAAIVATIVENKPSTLILKNAFSEMGIVSPDFKKTLQSPSAFLESPAKKRIDEFEKTERKRTEEFQRQEQKLASTRSEREIRRHRELKGENDERVEEIMKEVRRRASEKVEMIRDVLKKEKEQRQREAEQRESRDRRERERRDREDRERREKERREREERDRDRERTRREQEDKKRREREEHETRERKLREKLERELKERKLREQAEREREKKRAPEREKTLSGTTTTTTPASSTTSGTREGTLSYKGALEQGKRNIQGEFSACEFEKSERSGYEVIARARGLPSITRIFK
jgi:hypothetical protein